MNNKYFILLALTILLTSCTKENVSNDILRSSFLNPPNSAKPGVYWYFMDDNQDKGEMTADLESMEEVGIGHVLFLASSRRGQEITNYRQFVGFKTGLRAYKEICKKKS